MAEHDAYGDLKARLGELEDAEGSARTVLYRTEVARSKVEASPPARSLQERAEEARQRVQHASSRQVSFKLLLVAMADQLTCPGELRPLILDDPTPHFDAERTVAMLDLLLQLAESRQVVLFSQEIEVLAWAERHLVEPRHRLWRLPRRHLLN